MAQRRRRPATRSSSNAIDDPIAKMLYEMALYVLQTFDERDGPTSRRRLAEKVAGPALVAHMVKHWRSEFRKKWFESFSHNARLDDPDPTLFVTTLLREQSSDDGRARPPHEA